MAQVANTTPSDVNVLNLLAPFLNLNATTIGQQTLTSNLQQTLAVNNNATGSLNPTGSQTAAGKAAQEAQAISDKTLPGNVSAAFPTAGTITLVDGTKVTLGVADNLAGGEPLQAVQNSTNAASPKGTINPIQPVGGYGVVLGADYQKGIRASTPTTGPLANTFNLLNTAYTSASNNLGVAKNYFANGAATNPSTTPAGYVPVPAVAPAGYTLPTADGLPNTTNSPYDLAYGVTNKQSGQDVYGDSRPDQVALSQVNSFDPAALDGLATNPSFPSGHTTYAFTESELLAMLTPSLYQSMMARAADYGNDRIVLGVHYALDIIGSRSLATYDLAQEFANPLYINNASTTGTAYNLPSLFNAANTELSGFLTAAAATGLPATTGLAATAACGTSVATCATSAANTANDPYVPSNTTQATYRSELNYGLPIYTFAQAPVEAAPTSGPNPTGNADASVLLAPIYGGSSTAARTIAPNGGALGNLSTNTINQIIVQTEGQALQAFYGTSLSYWSRIDLYSAAGYFSGTNGTLRMAAGDVLNTNVQVGNTNTTLTAANALFNPTNAVLFGNGATINGRVNVLSGATFGGGTDMLATATTAPATTTINGSLTVQPGATYAVTVNQNGLTSSTKVNGTAIITGSNLGVVGSEPILPFTQVSTGPLLTATGGITGTFTSTSSSIAGATSFLTNSGGTLTVDRTDVDFKDFGATRNERHVASAIGLASLTNTNAQGGQLANALYTEAALTSVAAGHEFLNRISGEGLTATQNAAFDSSAAFVSSIEDEQNAWRAPYAYAPTATSMGRPLPGGAQGYASASQLPFPAIKGPLAAPPAPLLWRAWGGGFGGESNLDARPGIGLAHQTDDYFGGIVGLDYQMQPDFLVGAAAGGSSADFKVPGRATTGNVTGGHGALYATYNAAGGFYGQASLAFSGFDNTTHRVAGIGPFSATENAKFSSFEVRVRGEIGDRFNYGPWGITPFVAVEYANLNSDHFTETGPGGPNFLSLNVPSRTTESLPVFAGLRVDTTYAMGGDTVLRPFAQAAYIHEFDPARNLVANFVSLPGASFLVEGARPASDSAQIKAGFDLGFGHGVSLFANFEGEFSGVEDAYAGRAGLRVSF